MYYKCLSKADGLQTTCKACQYKFGCSDRNKRYAKKSKLKTKYDLSLEDFEFMLNAQKGLCAICCETDLLQVDHNHKTGKVRGLLCPTCNRGLGQFRDDFSTVMSAADYLSNY